MFLAIVAIARLPEEWMNAFVRFKITFRAINGCIGSHCLCSQVLEYPVCNTISPVVREDIVGVRAHIIQAGKPVFHDLWYATRSRDRRCIRQSIRHERSCCWHCTENGQTGCCCKLCTQTELNNFGLWKTWEHLLFCTCHQCTIYKGRSIAVQYLDFVGTEKRFQQ